MLFYIGREHTIAQEDKAGERFLIAAKIAANSTGYESLFNFPD